MMNTSQVNRLIVEIANLNKKVADILNDMTQQQKILNMRGMGLPSGFLDQLAEVSNKIENIKDRLTDQEPELAQLRELVRTMSIINSKLNIEEVLNDVMDNFVKLTEAERGFILLENPETGEMEFTVARGMDRDTLDESNSNISRTVMRDALTSVDAIITTNAMEDNRYNAQDSIMLNKMRSIICVPLRIKDKVIGVAYSDHRYRTALFGENEKAFLTGFGNQAAVAIENARLFQGVQEQLAEIDEMRNFLDNIFSSIASGVITLDQNGVLMTINPAAEYILGIKAEDNLGNYYSDVFPALYEGFDDLLNAVLNEGRQQTVEFGPVIPARGPVNLNMKLSPLRDEDNIMGVAIVIDDLTELKKRDETLRVLDTYLSAEMVKQIHNIDSLGLGGEERIISAISCDVRGFTTFSEQLEPEVLMRIINRYLTVSSDAIQLMEGIIDKFMGDAVLGLYNTQLNPQENHAVRCVRAAMMMIEDIKELHTELPPDQRLFYGIGIHTGPAILGNVGSPSRREFTAIGEAVVYSKKLEGVAEGGEILLSEETYHLVSDIVECEMVERQLRGSNVYRKMYKVLDRKR